MGPSDSWEQIYDDGRHYDRLMPGSRDEAFYQRQASKYGGPVLELGCGTGRLTVPLALDGADITGIDIAPGMLRVAREKAEQSGARLELVEGDVRSFDLGRQFQLIFFASNALSHLLRLEEIESCFECVRRHMAPDARFIVDLFTPSIQLLGRDPQEHFRVGEYEDPDGTGRISVTETVRYDPAAQVNHILWHYRRDGRAEAVTVPLTLRMFFPQEIDALLRYNGFSIEHKYGDFDERPYDAASAKQLIVCRRR